MTKRQLTLSIPTPCTEDWNTMIPDKNGKFCASCQKTVVDFSRMTDAEIFNYFDSFQGATCGRFSEKQLNRPVNAPLVLAPQNRWAWALSALLLPTIAASQTVKQESNNYYTPSVFRDNITVEKDWPTNITLRGVVMDSRDEVLIGVPIVVKGTNIDTFTDLDGRFELNFLSKEVNRNYFDIQVNYPGYDTLLLSIHTSDINKEQKITLKESIIPIIVKNISIQGGVKGVFQNIDFTLSLPTITDPQTLKTVELPPSVFEAKTKENDVEKAKSKEDITLRGVVWDNNYGVLAGASIVLKGTTKGIITDEIGRFELKLDEKDLVNDTIKAVVSYVGYKNKELQIGLSETHKDLIINLEESILMGDMDVFVHHNFFQRSKYRIKRFFRNLRNR